MEAIPAELLSLELRYMCSFVALADELNFRRAAERLHLTKSALSIQIKKLEEILEVRLFKRSNTHVRLTMAGDAFFHHAQELLARVQQVVEVTKEAAQGDRGRLRIGTPGNYNTIFLPKALQTYHQRFPKVDLTLLDLNMEEEQMEALEEDRIHLGFVYASALPRTKDIGHLLMIDAPVCVAMRAQHPLAAREQVSLAEVIDYPFLALQPYKKQTQKVLSALHHKKLAPKVITGVDSMNTCIITLIAGDGVALLPDVRLLSQNPALALRPIKDAPNLRLQIYAVWKKAGVSPHVQHFVELLRGFVIQHQEGEPAKKSRKA